MKAAMPVRPSATTSGMGYCTRNACRCSSYRSVYACGARTRGLENLADMLELPVLLRGAAAALGQRPLPSRAVIRVSLHTITAQEAPAARARAALNWRKFRTTTARQLLPRSPSPTDY